MSWRTSRIIHSLNLLGLQVMPSFQINGNLYSADMAHSLSLRTGLRPDWTEGAIADSLESYLKGRDFDKTEVFLLEV